uniref:hypothetical protein n=1 Tax=Altererythrobacter segetis TaxID=1104773 RepID=UPI00140AAB8D|nr:hypothetical protein [Altererythrobacter segetis]
MSDTFPADDPSTPAGLDEAPSPRAPRHRHWTRARMAAFLRELGAGASVAGAARAVGMGRQSAYKLRERLAGSAFDEAWQLAIARRERRRLERSRAAGRGVRHPARFGGGRG